MILTWAQAGNHSRKRGDHQQLHVKVGDSDRHSGKATENPQGPARGGGDRIPARHSLHARKFIHHLI